MIFYEPTGIHDENDPFEEKSSKAKKDAVSKLPFGHITKIDLVPTGDNMPITDDIDKIEEQERIKPENMNTQERRFGRVIYIALAIIGLVLCVIFLLSFI